MGTGDVDGCIVSVAVVIVSAAAAVVVVESGGRSRCGGSVDSFSYRRNFMRNTDKLIRNFLMGYLP